MQSRATIYSCFFSILMFLQVISLHAQTWQPLSSTLAPDVQDIVIKNDSLYIATLEGSTIFYRTLNAETWHFVKVSEKQGIVRNGLHGFKCMEINNGTYYASGIGIINSVDLQSYDHFFISNDYGKSWSTFRNGIEYVRTIYDILISTKNNVFIGSEQGVWFLNPAKNRFEQTGVQTSTHTIFEYNDTLLAGTREGISYSSDGGDTWTSTGPDTLQVFAISHNGHSFYVGTDQGLFTFSSIDQSWTKIEGLSTRIINALHSINGWVIAGTDSGAYKIDASTHEVQPAFPGLSNEGIYTINGHAGRLFIGSESGFYPCDVSQNSCNTNGVPLSMVQAMAFQNKDTLLASTFDHTYRYSLATQQWDSGSVPVEADWIAPVDSDSFYAVNSPFFYRCSFNNAHCDSARVDEFGYPLFGMAMTDAYLFVASNRKVFQSGDSGASWEVIHENPQRNNRDLFTIGDSLLLINSESGLIRYSIPDRTYQTTGFDSTGINDLFVTATGTIYVSAYRTILKSTDVGETWTTLLEPDDVRNEDILIEVEYDEARNKLYAISYVGTIYVSKDKGTHWGIHDELHPMYVENATIDSDGTLYIGSSGSGVFSNTNPIDPPITISVEGEWDLPNTANLLQNYPNPFNPSTQISYTLVQPGRVTLTVFDIHGRRVAQLVNNQHTAAGTYTVTFTATGLASGVYFYRLQSGTSVQTQKMVLIR